MERAYRNLGYFLLALLPIFIAGFWIPYLSEIPAFDPSITPPVHVHAVLLFSWIALLVFQPLAIRYRAFSAAISLAVIETCLAALFAFDIRRQFNARPYVVAFLAYNATALVWIALGRPV